MRDRCSHVEEQACESVKNRVVWMLPDLCRYTRALIQTLGMCISYSIDLLLQRHYDILHTSSIWYLSLVFRTDFLSLAA
jgi:hypothetical protein